MTQTPFNFSDALLSWHQVYGRKGLPWQQDPTPYRVWISEIMLQQTQVQTVIGYYQRFMARFPDVVALADAPLDEVLHLWSGLGYYARARNLHKSATLIRDTYSGEFPNTIDDINALPGIGRSTAGAILALSQGQRHAILDGNVKRVLCRFHGIEGWSGRADVQRELWARAEVHTPLERVADYTQAIMDLGATVCVRGQPKCVACPLTLACRARADGTTPTLPTPKPRKTQPVREARFIIVKDQRDRVLLEQRPPTGIWGGLWSFPECPVESDTATWCDTTLGLQVKEVQSLATLRHTFTHFHLHIEPVIVRLHERSSQHQVREGRAVTWYDPLDPAPLGLAAPVATLLGQLA